VAVHDDVRLVVGRCLHAAEHVLEHVDDMFGSIHEGHGGYHLLV